MLAALILGTGCGTREARVVIISPANGLMTTAPSVEVQAVLLDVNLDAVQEVRVNGLAVPPLAGAASFTAQVTLDPSQIDQPILVEVIGESGTTLRDRITVIFGTGLPDGDFSPQGIGLRLTDPGLDEIEPIVTDLVPLDLATLVPAGTLVLDGYCYLDSWFGCTGRVDASVSGNPAPSISDFNIDVDSLSGKVAADVTLSDLYFKLDVNAVTGIGFSCEIVVTAATALIQGDFDLAPDSSDPDVVDVSQLGGVNLVFSTFNDNTNCAGFLGGIVEFFVGLAISDLQNDFVKPGLEDFLNAEDASGNTPVAGSLEEALTAVDLTGPVGTALGVLLEAPLFAIEIDPDGITLDSDARVIAANPDPDAVSLTASYSIDLPAPAFPATAPNGSPYDLGLAISVSAFNQLMMAETESGLLLSTLTEIDFGLGAQPITAGTLALLLPEFAYLDPTVALQLDIRPTTAPMITAEAGPGEELVELLLLQLEIKISPTVEPSLSLLGGAVDVTLGVDIEYGADGLSFLVTPPTPDNLVVSVVKNPLFVDPAILEALMPLLVQTAIPTLADSLGSFNLPEFLGLQLTLVDLARIDGYLFLYFDLTPVAVP